MDQSTNASVKLEVMKQLSTKVYKTWILIRLGFMGPNINMYEQ